MSVYHSNIMKTKLYHGSLTKYDKEIKPTSIDFGNRFQKAGWSIFCWKEKEKAYKWATWMYVLMIIGEIEEHPKSVEHKEFVKVCKILDNKDYVSWEFSDDNVGILLSPKILKIVLRWMDKTNFNNKKTYVYSIRQPMYRVGLGNTAYANEYTIRDTITDFTRDEIKMNKASITKYCRIYDGLDAEYYKTNDIKHTEHRANNRIGSNTISKAIWNKEYVEHYKTHNEIYKKMKAGEVEVGDDLTQFI